MKFKIIAIAFILNGTIFAQNNVGIGTTTPSPSAALDVTATDKGVLVPRLTTAQRLAIATPTEGLLVYDINVDCFFFYETTSGTWANLCQAGNAGPTGPQGPAGVAGPQGVAGATGPAGANGTNGTNGIDGVNGAAGATGPAGTNGIDGINGATGPTGAAGPQGPAGANGAVGATGPQGPTGIINKYHLFGTAGRAAVSSVTATLQPGLSQVINLTATQTVNIWATIGALNTSTTAGQYSTVDMIIYVDGAFLAVGGWNRFTVVNPTGTNGFNTCAINTQVSLPAGAHTIEVRTARFAGSTTVSIGGNATTDTNPGELTILISN